MHEYDEPHSALITNIFMPEIYDRGDLIRLRELSIH